MADTPRNYAAFRGAGCARDRVPGHDGQTDLRLIGAVQIIEPISRAPYRGARKRSRAPERCIFNGPPGPGARGLNDATTISETNPLMINKGIRQPRRTRERLSRTTCPLNIHEPPRVRRERDVGRGGLAEGLIVITLICLLHIPAIDRRYRSLVRSDRIIESFDRFYQPLY